MRRGVRHLMPLCCSHGKDLSQWTSADGQPAKWKVADGCVEVVPHSGIIQTRQPFGDCQLHVESTEPAPPAGEGQERGNSGVFLMGLYEIQVLDSYQSKTYADGQASAVYAQFPPQVNASQAPGQWQAYDIIFHGPRFDKDGKCLRPARVTVLAQWSAGAGQRGTIRAPLATTCGLLQADAGQAVRSVCRTTTTRCASAISGFANWARDSRAPHSSPPGRIPVPVR